MGGAYWPALPEAEANAIVAASLEGGINWFDTAELYGNGASETALARALKAAGKQSGDVVVATKWWPVMRLASNIGRSIDDRLRYLDGFAIDLYQVHQPWGLSSVAAEMEGMAELLQAGKIRSIGVSNFGAGRMRAAAAALEKRSLTLASNQVRYSLLDRRIEANGVMDAAKELGVTIIAYSPLAQGLLSGKFHDDPGLVTGPRRLNPAYRRRGLARTRPLIDALREVGAAHEATPSQVALAWVLQFHGHTVVAIPGATKRRHVEENVAAAGLELTPAQLQRLDEVSRALV
jgi:aryl-alcohol dehydrogenase-like predicted oxidoreductase